MIVVSVVSRSTLTKLSWTIDSLEVIAQTYATKTLILSQLIGHAIPKKALDINDIINFRRRNTAPC